LVSF
jgi:hypothetical protein